MAHNAIDTVGHVRSAICAQHGGHSDECRHLHAPAAMAAGGALGLMVGGMVAGKEGAVWGAGLGILFGALFPEAAQPERLAPIAKALHGSGGK